MATPLSPFAGSFSGPNTTVLLLGPKSATRTALAWHICSAQTTTSGFGGGTTGTTGTSGGGPVMRCHMAEDLPLDPGTIEKRPTLDVAVLVAFANSADSLALAHENMAHLGSEYLQTRCILALLQDVPEDEAPDHTFDEDDSDDEDDDDDDGDSGLGGGEGSRKCQRTGCGDAAARGGGGGGGGGRPEEELHQRTGAVPGRGRGCAGTGTGAGMGAGARRRAAWATDDASHGVAAGAAAFAGRWGMPLVHGSAASPRDLAHVARQVARICANPSTALLVATALGPRVDPALGNAAGTTTVGTASTTTATPVGPALGASDQEPATAPAASTAAAVAALNPLPAQATVV